MGDNPTDDKPNKGAESNTNSSENNQGLERKHVSYASIYLVLRYKKGK